MPCLGPPSGDPDLRYPFPTHEFRCDLRNEDPQRMLDIVLDLSVPASVTGNPNPYFCACPTPRFDAVTIAGVRHSEFCCACGRPGPNDHTC